MASLLHVHVPRCAVARHRTGPGTEETCCQYPIPSNQHRKYASGVRLGWQRGWANIIGRSGRPTASAPNSGFAPAARHLSGAVPRCDWHGPGGRIGSDGTRTRTGRILSPLPLPIGLLTRRGSGAGGPCGAVPHDLNVAPLEQILHGTDRDRAGRVPGRDVRITGHGRLQIS